jgi:hypothetical protein
MGHVAAIMFLLITAHLLAARMPETIKRQQLPTSMSVTKNHVIALDAAVASGVVGERVSDCCRTGNTSHRISCPICLS